MHTKEAAEYSSRGVRFSPLWIIFDALRTQLELECTQAAAEYPGEHNLCIGSALRCGDPKPAPSVGIDKLHTLRHTVC